VRACVRARARVFRRAVVVGGMCCSEPLYTNTKGSSMSELTQSKGVSLRGRGG
jgi:hypothetical protein